MSDGEPDIDLDTVSLLVPLAKQGSDDARAELLEHVQDYMRLMAKQNAPANLQGKFGLSDVVQQSLAQVIQGFDKFKGNSASEFYGWLKTIVANEARQIQRDYRAEKRNVERERPITDGQNASRAGTVLRDDQPTPGTQALAAEQIEQLHTAIDRLPDDYAEVLRLRSLDRLSFKDVASRMDRSVNSVTKLWYRAMVKLEKELGPEDG